MLFNVTKGKMIDFDLKIGDIPHTNTFGLSDQLKKSVTSA